MGRVLAALCVFACIFLHANRAFAYEEIKNPFFLDYQTEIPQWSNGKFDWCYTHYKRIGVFSCLKATRGYAQAYIGPTVEFSNWLRLGAGAGFEAGRKEALSARYGGFVDMRRDRVDFTVQLETGKRGFWYRGVLEAEVGSSPFFGLSMGVMAEKLDGAGPRIALDMRKAYTKIWVAPLYNWEEKEVCAKVGARVIFY